MIKLHPLYCFQKSSCWSDRFWNYSMCGNASWSKFKFYSEHLSWCWGKRWSMTASYSGFLFKILK